MISVCECPLTLHGCSGDRPPFVAIMLSYDLSMCIHGYRVIDTNIYPAVFASPGSRRTATADGKRTGAASAKAANSGDIKSPLGRSRGPSRRQIWQRKTGQKAENVTAGPR